MRRRDGITAKRAELRALQKKLLTQTGYWDERDVRRRNALLYAVTQHRQHAAKAKKARQRYSAPRAMPRVSMTAMRQLWRIAFDEPAPKNLRVVWSLKPFGRSLGCAHYSSGLIEMAWERFDPDSKLRSGRNWYGNRTTGQWCVLGVLIHEFVHIRMGAAFRHGAEFNRIERTAQRAAGIPAHL